jgi:hypothetical protein
MRNISAPPLSTVTRLSRRIPAMMRDGSDNDMVGSVGRR